MESTDHKEKNKNPYEDIQYSIKYSHYRDAKDLYTSSFKTPIYYSGQSDTLNIYKRNRLYQSDKFEPK